MVVPQDRAVAAVEHLPENQDSCVSIIIPVFNEAANLQQNLQRLFELLQADPQVEVIVCDGGSKDSTTTIARQFPCKVINSAPGRARQMNTASRVASGTWLVFLHADSQLPANWKQSVINAGDWGFFPLKLSGQRWPFRIIEYAICLRSSLSKVATGDQGLFFRRAFFDQLKAFSEIPLMEDIAISKKARRLAKPSIADQVIITSSRRWEQQGIIRTLLLMWALRFAYWLGVSPERLQRFYYPRQTL